MSVNKKEKKGVAAKSTEPSVFSPVQIKKFVEEVKAEFLKIVWPDKKMTLGLTGIVVLLTVVISIYLGAVDLLLGQGVGALLK